MASRYGTPSIPDIGFEFHRIQKPITRPDCLSQTQIGQHPYFSKALISKKTWKLIRCNVAWCFYFTAMNSYTYAYRMRSPHMGHFWVSLSFSVATNLQLSAGSIAACHIISSSPVATSFSSARLMTGSRHICYMSVFQQDQNIPEISPVSGSTSMLR